MFKMLTPGFPPRRPAGWIRLAVLTMLIMLGIYTLRYTSGDLHTPAAQTEPASNMPPDYLNQPTTDEKTGIELPLADKETTSHVIPEGHFVERPEKQALENDPTGLKNKVDSSPSKSDSTASGPEGVHPIDKLIYDAQHTFAEITSKESKTLEEAAQAYRKRRGRHPPPGFHEWFEFAQNHSALVVEDFWDQIYVDLEPFWGMEPAVMRKETWDFEMTINIRSGIASSGSDWFWTTIWLDLIQTIEHLLPDMDLALNAMDEPRLVVPWEDIDEYMKKAAKTVNLPPPKTVSATNQKLPIPGKGDVKVKTRPKNWENTSQSCLFV